MFQGRIDIVASKLASMGGLNVFGLPWFCISKCAKIVPSAPRLVFHNHDRFLGVLSWRSYILPRVRGKDIFIASIGLEVLNFHTEVEILWFVCCLLMLYHLLHVLKIFIALLLICAGMTTWTFGRNCCYIYVIKTSNRMENKFCWGACVVVQIW